MSSDSLWLFRGIKTIGLVLAVGISMSADAGLFGFGSTSWKEEALQSDGSKIIVERSITLGGRHEIGQEPPIKEQSLNFVMPGTNQHVSWKDEFSEDLGTANFLPMQLDVSKNTAYLVAAPMGCLSYNKWGRPNPPYVVFKYQDNAWKRIPLQSLPTEFKQLNLAFSSPDHAAKEARHGLLTTDQVREWNSDAQQPQYKSILREPMSKDRISAMCMEMILYKGYWIMPNDPVARLMVDRKSK